MAEVRLDNVDKVYRAARSGEPVAAVRGLSLTIADGEFVVLVGPSGCGKSTALRMIAGLEEATSGSISIGGRVVNDVEPKDRDVAMVFQNYALYPHMTVAKNIGFPLSMRGMPREAIGAKVREVSASLGIAELLERRPGELSGGQRQRVALARAIVREPKVFLFDEPLSNLDAKLRVTTRAEIKQLHQRLRITTVYVTHDQEEAMTLGDRVVVMSQGRIQQADTPMRVYHEPANRFVAGFVGTPPMNFLSGQITQHASGMRFVVAGDSRGECSLPFPAGIAPPRAGAGVLGLRPSVFLADPAAGWPTIRATLLSVEPLGEHADLTLALAGGTRLVARIESQRGLPHHCRPGDTITLGVDMARTHVFEEAGPARPDSPPSQRLWPSQRN